VQDITEGQILGGAVVFGIEWTLPAFLMDWTMSLQPNGDWKRRTKILGFPEGDGFYLLRTVVDGEGKPGPAYDDWVKQGDEGGQGGPNFLYLERFSPAQD
jgi:hypothetical protein